MMCIVHWGLFWNWLGHVFATCLFSGHHNMFTTKYTCWHHHRHHHHRRDHCGDDLWSSYSVHAKASWLLSFRVMIIISSRLCQYQSPTLASWWYTYINIRLYSGPTKSCALWVHGGFIRLYPCYNNKTCKLCIMGTCNQQSFALHSLFHIERRIICKYLVLWVT